MRLIVFKTKMYKQRSSVYASSQTMGSKLAQLPNFRYVDGGKAIEVSGEGYGQTWNCLFFVRKHSLGLQKCPQNSEISHPNLNYVISVCSI